jgi:hypothetical protein
MNVTKAKSGRHSLQGALEFNSFPIGPPASRRMNRHTTLVSLPLGYVDEKGIRHDQVELASLSGFEEEFLAGLSLDASTAAVVSALLGSCIRTIGSIKNVTAETVANLLVGDREYLMLKLRELTVGKKLDAVLFCDNPACGKPMDLTLSLDNFIPDSRSVSRRFFTLEIPSNENGAKCFSVNFRLPTGADQEMAAVQGWSVDQLLSRILVSVNGRTSVDEQFVRALPSRVKQEIEAEMERLAPGFTIELEAACPECGTPSVSPLDLVAFFIAEINKNLRNLEWQVHLLASHYHWPEHEILALPRRRRQRYIELIQGGSFWAQASLSGNRERSPGLQEMLNV